MAVGVQTPRTLDGEDIDLVTEWRWASIYDLVSAAVDESVTPDTEAYRLADWRLRKMSLSSRSGGLGR